MKQHLMSSRTKTTRRAAALGVPAKSGWGLQGRMLLGAVRRDAAGRELLAWALAWALAEAASPGDGVELGVD